MRHNFFNGFLRAEAAEHGDAGGGATPPAQTTAAPEPEKKPGVIELAVAGLQSKAKLNGEIATLKQQLATANEALVTVTGERDSFAAKVSAFESQHAQLSAALAAAADERQTVDEAAAAMLRSHGVAPQELPPASVEGDTKEELIARMNKATDDKERFDLAKRLNEMD